MEDRYFVWHDVNDTPATAVALVVKTNHVGSYYIGCFSDKWWLKKGPKYVEHSQLLSPNEKITGWAYVGGEAV